MRNEDRTQIAFLRRHKGFSDKGIARHTGLPLIEVQAELKLIDGGRADALAGVPVKVRT